MSASHMMEVRLRLPWIRSTPTVVMLAGMVRLFRLSHSVKHSYPNVAIFPDRSMEVRPELQKQEAPISLKSLGSSIVFRELQSPYLLFVDYQYCMIKKVEKWIYRFYLRSKRARFNVFNLYLMENPYLA